MIISNLQLDRTTVNMERRFYFIYTSTAILAFCSLVYELLLGQLLSAYLGNTVLRYSVTIGLYMLAMGIGSLLAEGGFRKYALRSLQWVELSLTVIGGASIFLVACTDALLGSTLAVSLVSHLLIIVIGILTGFEIPLLMYVHSKLKDGADNIILGIDYLGALVGSILFAFFFYPKLGLVTTALTIAGLNALVGVILPRLDNDKSKNAKKQTLAVLQGLLLLLVIGLLLYRQELQEWIIQQFITA